jgi:cell pole-organizing protein PopZ
MSGAAAPGGATPKGSNDPAMDDILASIRRILNEDEANGGAPAAASTAPDAVPRPTPESEPLDLTESMMVKPAVTSVPLPVPEATPPGFEAEESSSSGAATKGEGLVAPAVAAATTAALGQLLRTVAAERTTPVHRGGPSIEEVVREEIRPLLKAWLDTHLPPLVERLVRAEIERVVGRAL